jgi:beta-glucosidase
VGVLDDFEWAFGYNYRYGLNYVDYNDNLKRYPRASAHWFKDVLIRKEKIFYINHQRKV